jgi:hypothetical protein
MFKIIFTTILIVLFTGSESCIHPLAGKRDAITSKICNEHNDFCPYNEVN